MGIKHRMSLANPSPKTPKVDTKPQRKSLGAMKATPNAASPQKLQVSKRSPKKTAVTSPPKKRKSMGFEEETPASKNAMNKKAAMIKSEEKVEEFKSESDFDLERGYDSKNGMMELQDEEKEESDESNENLKKEIKKMLEGKSSDSEEDNYSDDNIKQELEKIDQELALESDEESDEEEEESKKTLHKIKMDPQEKGPSEKKSKVKNYSQKEAENTIFVGNLPKEISTDEVKKMFKMYGKIKTARLRSAPVADSRTPLKVAVIKKEFHADRTNINAYVVFQEKESVDKALAANGVIIQGRHIVVDRAVQSEPDHKKAIFVGNVPFCADEEQLYKIFESCGPIESVRIVRNFGIGKGFAFINFKNADAVELALMKSGEKLLKRELRVHRCVAKDAKKKQKNRPGKNQNHQDPKNQAALNREAFKKRKNKKNRPAKIQDGPGKSGDNALPAASFQGEKTAGKVQKKKNKAKKLSVKKKQAVETLVKSMPEHAKEGKKKQMVKSMPEQAKEGKKRQKKNKNKDIAA